MFKGLKLIMNIGGRQDAGAFGEHVKPLVILALGNYLLSN